MNCESCGVEPDHLYLIPVKQSDGRLNKLVCYECALSSGAYCQKHDTPHMGFDQAEKGACLKCIEELVQENMVRAGDLLRLFLDNLSNPELLRLREWISDIQEFIADSDANCLLRALATQAKCASLAIDEVIRQTIDAQSVDAILPWAY